MNIKNIAFIIGAAALGSIGAHLGGFLGTAATDKISQASSSLSSLLPSNAQAAQGSASASAICGQVVKVYDGDTLTMTTTAGQKQRVRLAQIDAPEKQQAYGETSARALAELVLHESVCIKPAGKDGQFEQSYDRKVAWVERQRDGLQVNRRMVASGNAYVGEKRYLTDYSLLRDQQEAQESSSGLWAIPESQRILPSEWRKAHAAH